MSKKISQKDIDDLYSLLNKRCRSAMKDYSEETKNIVMDIVENGEKFDDEKWLSLIEVSRKNKTIQTALVKSPYFDFFNSLYDGKVYKDVDFDALKNPVIPGFPIVIAKILSHIGENSFNEFCSKIKGDKKALDEINPIIWSKIVVDYGTNSTLKGSCETPSVAIITAFENTSNTVAINQILNSNIKHKLPEVITTAIANNGHIKDELRTKAFNLGFRLPLLTNPSPDMIEKLYENAMDDYINIGNKAFKTKEEQDNLMISTEFLENLIKKKLMTESQELDMMMRLFSSHYSCLPAPCRLMDTLMYHSQNDSLIEFYASGMYTRPDEYRKLVYTNYEMPFDSRASIMLIELDDMKNIDNWNRNVYIFLRDSITYAKLHEKVYDEIGQFKDSGVVEICLENPTLYNQFMSLCKYMTIADNTPINFIKELQQFHYSDIDALALLREEFENSEIKSCKISDLIALLEPKEYEVTPVVSPFVSLNTMEQFREVLIKAEKRFLDTPLQKHKMAVIGKKETVFDKMKEDLERTIKSEKYYHDYQKDLYYIVEDFHHQCKTTYDVYLKIDEFIDKMKGVLEQMHEQEDRRKGLTVKTEFER